MSETCQAFSYLMMSLPVLGALSVCHRARDKGLSWCVMVGALIYHLFNFSTVLVLGNLGLLSPSVYRGAMTSLAVVLGVCALIRLPGLFRALVALRYRPQLVDVPIGVGLWYAACIVRHEFHFNWVEGPLLFDSLNYHIPRALQWLWSGSLEPFRTAIWQQVGHAFGGTAAVVTPIFYGCGWLGSAFNTQVFSLGAAAALIVIGKALGLSARGALVAALAFLSFPAVGLRYSDVSTDIAAAFPVIAAVALALTRDSLEQGVFRFIALVGLGTACKQYVAFPAVPLGLMIFAPQLRAILAWRCVGAAISGFALGLSFCALSFYPIYANFGDLTGGGVAGGLSTVGGGMPAVRDALWFTFISWFFEPLGALPEEMRGEMFRGWGIDRLMQSADVSVPPNGPMIDHEHIRAGFLPLALLPWLFLGVPKGWRWRSALGFVVICLAQFSFLAKNHVGARFAIIPLAALALLWGARATSRAGFRSVVQSLVATSLVVIGLWCDVAYVEEWHRWTDRYAPEREENVEISSITKDNTVVVLSHELSTDAMVAGRTANVPFIYANCPLDGDWVRALAEYRKSYRWFLFSVVNQKTVPGPTYPSRLGPPCEEISLEQLRAWLLAAGWTFEVKTRSHYELWRAP